MRQCFIVCCKAFVRLSRSFAHETNNAAPGKATIFAKPEKLLDWLYLPDFLLQQGFTLLPQHVLCLEQMWCGGVRASKVTHQAED